MLHITAHSHLDHFLEMSHLELIFLRFDDHHGFLATTIPMSDEWLGLPCGLYGPAMGDDPVSDAEVRMVVRGKRRYASRILRGGQLRRSDLLTVIAAPMIYGDEHSDDHLELITAFGGPLAPREPGDPSLPPDERAASELFWSQHALCIPPAGPHYECSGCGGYGKRVEKIEHHDGCTVRSGTMMVFRPGMGSHR